MALGSLTTAGKASQTISRRVGSLHCAYEGVHGAPRSLFFKDISVNSYSIRGSLVNLIGNGLNDADLRVGNGRKVSDDTVLHLATAEGMIEAGRATETDEIIRIVVKHCKRGMRDMKDRAPGNTTMRQYSVVGSEGQGWDATRFNPRGGGCGAAMRSMCIGLRFPAADQQRRLLEVALETGRATHHNAIGYGGAIVGALFTSLAVRNVPPVVWGNELLQCDRVVREILDASERDVADNLESWDSCLRIWSRYLESVGLLDATEETVFHPPRHDRLDFAAWDADYKQIAGFNPRRHWPGSAGVDAALIAYQSLLVAEADAERGPERMYETLCLRAMIHGGDNDSTGVMAGAWFGARHAWAGVPDGHWAELEYKTRMMEAGAKLRDIAEAEAGV